MALSSQGGANVNPIGMKRKKKRMAPIIQEQARQGIATKSVADAKAKAQADQEWEFNKASREAELRMQERQLEMNEKMAKHQKNMGYVQAGLGVLSTGIELLDWLDI
jgi:hypothetical protein